MLVDRLEFTSYCLFRQQAILKKNMQLRHFQQSLSNDIDRAWENGADNVLAVAPTGSGKTVLFAHKIAESDSPAVAIAHRQELVTQISIALARNDVVHKIIGPQNVVRQIVNFHMDECGRSFYNPSAHVAVAGVDTLIRRGDELRDYCRTVTKWIQDEAHHVLTSNKWGKAASMFPNALGLGVTATPRRADRKGLGRLCDGLFDEMVIGPSMRELINQGYLTDYRVFAPKTDDLNLSAVPISETTGDYNQFQMKVAVRKSHIIGDVVKHYLKIAPGKLGVTFVPDIETANETAAEYNAAGVPAAVVTAETPDRERASILRRFKKRELLQLVNVDLFGEGFDLPAIEVVSMARPTQSFALYCQQFGRALRLMISDILAGTWDNYSIAQRLQFIAQSGKSHAIIIDHVGNVERHGLPDAQINWTLDRGDKREKSKPTDGIPVKACPECTAVYERIFKECPFCGFKPIPSIRSGPEFVDGDLFELDILTLAQMRGEIERVDMPPEVYRQELIAKYTPKIGVLTHVKRHTERQEIQNALRQIIAWWAGCYRAKGADDSEIYRRFYFAFGVDMLTAQFLNTREATDLANRINAQFAGLV